MHSSKLVLIACVLGHVVDIGSAGSRPESLITFKSKLCQACFHLLFLF